MSPERYAALSGPERERVHGQIKQQLRDDRAAFGAIPDRPQGLVGRRVAGVRYRARAHRQEGGAGALARARGAGEPLSSLAPARSPPRGEPVSRPRADDAFRDRRRAPGRGGRPLRARRWEGQPATGRRRAPVDGRVTVGGRGGQRAVCSRRSGPRRKPSGRASFAATIPTELPITPSRGGATSAASSASPTRRRGWRASSTAPSPRYELGASTRRSARAFRRHGDPGLRPDAARGAAAGAARRRAARSRASLGRFSSCPSTRTRRGVRSSPRSSSARSSATGERSPIAIELVNDGGWRVAGISR